MPVDMETIGTQVDSGWRDRDGFIGPIQPGRGPRSDPKGAFPTGPDVGERMPEVRAMTADGEILDLHGDRSGQPAVFVFFRSAVW